MENERLFHPVEAARQSDWLWGRFNCQKGRLFFEKTIW